VHDARRAARRARRGRAGRRVPVSCSRRCGRTSGVPAERGCA
jgi:hypothetical protein